MLKQLLCSQKREKIFLSNLATFIANKRFVFAFTIGLLHMAFSAQAQFCGMNNINGGTITPSITTVQTVTGQAGGIYYWSFEGTAGVTYKFSTCNASEDTYLRIYDIDQNPLASNDDNGYACSSSAASLYWTCNANSNYSIYMSHYSCTTLSGSVKLVYDAIPLSPPIVTGINPVQGTDANGYLSVLGSNFGSVEYVYFKLPDGGTTYTSYFSKYDNYILLYAVPSDVVTGNLTLTGGFGMLATNYSYVVVAPSVTGITPIQGADVNGQIYLYGTHLESASYVYLPGSNGGTTSVYLNHYGNSVYFYVPSDAVSGALTVTGSFGILPTNYFYTPTAPTVTGINPLNGTDANGYLSVLGNNFGSVGYAYFESSNGGTTHTSILDKYSNYLLLSSVPSDAITGNITLTGGFGSLVTGYSYIATAPTVTGIYPLQGATPYGYLSILGTNFGSVGYVYFKSAKGGVTYTTSFFKYNNYLEIYSIPYDAITGIITLTGGFGSLVTGYSYIGVIPTVTGINPLHGTDSDGYLSVLGTNFGSVGYVKFKALNARYTKAFFTEKRENYLRVPVPSDAVIGLITLTGGFGELATSLYYTDGQPTVTGINPVTGKDIHGNITLTGFNMNSITRVYFPSLAGQSAYVNLSPNDLDYNYHKTGTYISFHIPSESLNGMISVSGAFGILPIYLTYSDTRPTITGINPALGREARGGYVSISGLNMKAIISVYFSSVLKGKTSWDLNPNDIHESYVRVSVPYDAMKGNITVSGGFGALSTSISYSDTQPLATGINPVQDTDSNGLITITGNNMSVVGLVFFTTTSGGTTFSYPQYDYYYDVLNTYSDGPVEHTYSSTKISNNFIVPVPAAAATGPITLTGGFGKLVPSFYYISSTKSVTGINEAMPVETELSIYPNPSNGEFTVYSSVASTSIIHNAMGGVAATIDIARGGNKFKLTLPSGLYYFTLRNITRKVLIE